MPEKLTPARANLLRIAAYSTVELIRDGALEPTYREGGRSLSGHEANGFQWLLNNGFVQADGRAMYNLPLGEVRPTAKGLRWLAEHKER